MNIDAINNVLIGILVGCVVIACIIVLIILMANKKSKKDPNSKMTEAEKQRSFNSEAC